MPAMKKRCWYEVLKNGKHYKNLNTLKAAKRAAVRLSRDVETGEVIQHCPRFVCYVPFGRTQARCHSTGRKKG